MEREERDNIIRQSEKPLQKQCFWKIKVKIQWFKLFLEFGLEKSGILNPEGRNPESRTAMDSVTWVELF